MRMTTFPINFEKLVSNLTNELNANENYKLMNSKPMYFQAY